MTIENKSENQLERRTETVEFYVEKGSDYPGFQHMLSQLDRSCFDVKIIVGPSDKYILPALITTRKDNPQKYFGEKAISEGLMLVRLRGQNQVQNVSNE